jgi:signal transduction histidine kinase/CheY-like chemotaxis protein
MVHAVVAPRSATIPFSRTDFATRGIDGPDPWRTVAGHPSEPLAIEAAPAVQDERVRHVRAAQIRLLYGNSNTGIAVTVIAASALAYFQWGVVPSAAVLTWVGYMLLVAAARFILGRRYWHRNPSLSEIGPWCTAFAVGAGMAAVGWGAAGILLYPEARLMNQVFLVFVLGGMMLGGASLLAPRAEAFLAFLLPTGLLPAIRLLSDGDEEHIIMGLLAILFTAATVTTTWRVHRTIESSLSLQFENQELVQNLRAAKQDTDFLNEQLERRVEARTAELRQSTERLRAEITQREHMEEELLRVRKLESLGVLAGGIAHDFNNFLTVIQGNVELARMGLDPGAAAGEILEQTADACQRAVVLSSQLLTFAKGGSPVRRVTSVDMLILDAVRLARAGASVTVAVHVADDLWSAEVDAGQIGQVLHNILLNAKQAMPAGGNIEVLAENLPAGRGERKNQTDCVRISIRDSGCGIPKEVLPLIFDPYFSTRRAGSGLGLATAYAIVSKHGGRLSAKSKDGKGAVFVIDLPASHATPVPEAEAGTILRSGTGRLLVMDDEETIRQLLSTMLGRLGYDVVTAGDGAEALALYEHGQASGHKFDAVLLDLTVSGGMGGAETAARLKALDPAARLIASSGYADAPVMANFRAYGFDDVIPKPWALNQIGDVFRRVLTASNPPRT